MHVIHIMPPPEHLINYWGSLLPLAFVAGCSLVIIIYGLTGKH